MSEGMYKNEDESWIAAQLPMGICSLEIAVATCFRAAFLHTEMSAKEGLVGLRRSNDGLMHSLPVQ
jgi:hypothetical protein